MAENLAIGDFFGEDPPSDAFEPSCSPSSRNCHGTPLSLVVRGGVGAPWSPRVIRNCLCKLDPTIFSRLCGQTVGKWIDKAARAREVNSSGRKRFFFGSTAGLHLVVTTVDAPFPLTSSDRRTPQPYMREQGAPTQSLQRSSKNYAPSLLQREISEGVTFKCSDAFVKKFLRDDLGWSERKGTRAAQKKPEPWKTETRKTSKTFLIRVKLSFSKVPTGRGPNAELDTLQSSGTRRRARLHRVFKHADLVDEALSRLPTGKGSEKVDTIECDVSLPTLRDRGVGWRVSAHRKVNDVILIKKCFEMCRLDDDPGCNVSCESLTSERYRREDNVLEDESGEILEDEPTENLDDGDVSRYELDDDGAVQSISPIDLDADEPQDDLIDQFVEAVNAANESWEEESKA
ncbi:hypothetical protein SCHPADRAFT_946493 [Schizopora paradoxa]|uniref:Uncharacterized protein n=1 Tax=Schizopora paradoxa TaxID=27342 RepID=A0A0H2RM87_9AGAM|nr:hypothetical protein SCHPADRAFT_946493 [Schizopora paradoxa]